MDGGSTPPISTKKSILECSRMDFSLVFIGHALLAIGGFDSTHPDIIGIDIFTENHYICGMRFFEKYIPGDRRINPALLWDYDTERIDPLQCKRLIATRVIQLGKLEDFYAAFDTFGGIEEFALIAKNEVTGLDAKDLNFICYAFDLKKEETQCYKRAQSRKRLLNS